MGDEAFSFVIPGEQVDTTVAVVMEIVMEEYLKSNTLTQIRQR